MTRLPATDQEFRWYLSSVRSSTEVYRRMCLTGERMGIAVK